MKSARLLDFGMSICLLKALLNLGLKQCQHDQCLFYKANLLIVLYVDNASIAAPEAKYINEFITSLETKGFTLTKEGTFSKFLSIMFTEIKEVGTITLTQKGLINSFGTTSELCTVHSHFVKKRHFQLN
jgi:hypothetical protein